MISCMISYLFDNIIVAQETGNYDVIHDIIGFCMISYMILYMIFSIYYEIVHDIIGLAFLARPRNHDIIYDIIFFFWYDIIYDITKKYDIIGDLAFLARKSVISYMISYTISNDIDTFPMKL
jgi:hypothetical protein